MNKAKKFLIKFSLDESAPIPNRDLLAKKIDKSNIAKKYKATLELKQMIADEIHNMAWEVEQSEAGSRKVTTIINPEDKQGYLKTYYTGSASTFPEYLSDIYDGKGSKDKFYASIRAGSGKHFDKITNLAIQRLEKGYSNKHGYDEPNKDFIDLVIANDKAVPF